MAKGSMAVAWIPACKPVGQARLRDQRGNDGGPGRGCRPLAVAGIVENGLVRPLDTSVKLLEHSRVIIVASEWP